ncbi:MAG: hypothetical protein H8E57_05210 [Candidatus Cloacimonetes bacterium]|nr:hypothetical protein [Candidatus Cloacimonadota bacterium]
MRRNDIKEMLKNSASNSFRFDFENFVVDDFIWEEENSQIFETVNMQYVVLNRDQIESILKGRNEETSYWKGTVIARNDEEVCDPAYGGDSNTNGIPEMGSIVVYLSDLQSSKSMVEY